MWQLGYFVKNENVEEKHKQSYSYRAKLCEVKVYKA